MKLYIHDMYAARFDWIISYDSSTDTAFLMWIKQNLLSRMGRKEKIASGKVRLGLSQHWKGSRKINSWLTCSKIRFLREGDSLIDVNCVQFSSLIFEIAGDEEMSCTHTWDEFNDGEQTTLNNWVNL